MMMRACALIFVLFAPQFANSQAAATCNSFSGCDTLSSPHNKGTVALPVLCSTTCDVSTCCEASSSPLSTINFVFLGTAGDFALLTKAGVTTTGVTIVNGDMGTSPIAATAITGFALTLDATTQFSTSALVTGQVYAADYTEPTPTAMTQAISDMETAYLDAAGRENPDKAEFLSGSITGQTLLGGLHTWSSSVTFSSLSFDARDSPDTVWILQIAGDLNLGNVLLLNDAKASNIFWQVAGEVQIPGTHAEGIILCKTAIIFGSGSWLNGRGLAQTAVTMDATTIVAA